MPNFTTFILVFSFAYECVHVHVCIVRNICLHFIHIDIGYECIVEINLLT